MTYDPVWPYGYYDYVPYGYYSPFDPLVDIAAFSILCAALW